MAEVLRRVAEVKDRERIVHRFEDSAVEELSYRGLDEKSSQLTGKIKDEETVLLMYPPGLDFIIAFYACLKAGVIAVPVAAVDPRGRSHGLEVAKGICENCKAHIGLTNAYYKNIISMLFTEIQWLATDTIVAEAYTKMNKIAFLQYTSGSTSKPKGVIITNSNLNHNLKLIVAFLEADENTICCSWLPQFHDMGLIGSYLGTAYCQGRGVHFSPLSFVKKPTLWPETMARVQATHTQAPSFAYGLAARKAWGASVSYKLSSLKHAINAAEPVRASDIDAFCLTFDIDPKVIRPTYGLAEHTVFVSTNGSVRAHFCSQSLFELKRAVPLTESQQDVHTLFGCGIPPASVTVKIVNEKNEVVASPDQVGEIWLSSDSVAAGYYGTEDSFEGFLKEDDETTRYLRTGDLGFFYQDELFICGRLKDLIIIRGKNYYPQDLERSLEDLSKGALRPGCTAAFQTDDSSITLVAEMKEYIDPLPLSAALGRIYALEPPRIILVKPRSVPKTTSGKISRNLAKRKLEAGELPILEATSVIRQETHTKKKRSAAETLALKKKTMQLSLTEIEQELYALTKKVLGPDIELPEKISDLGLESLQGLHFIAEIDEATGFDLDPEILFDETLTVQTLATILKYNQIPKKPLVINGIKAALGQKDVRKYLLDTPVQVQNCQEAVRRLDLCLSIFQRALFSVGIILFAMMTSKRANALLVVAIVFVLALAFPLKMRRKLIFGKRDDVLLAALGLNILFTDFNLFKDQKPKLIVAFVQENRTALHAAIAALTYTTFLNEAPVLLLAAALPKTLTALKLAEADTKPQLSSQKLIADALFAHRDVLLLLPHTAAQHNISRLFQLTKAANAILIPALQRENHHIIGSLDGDLSFFAASEGKDDDESRKLKPKEEVLLQLSKYT